jgi:HSP20 family protein
MIAAERPTGMSGRDLILGDSLDTPNVSADHADGLLRLCVPIAEEAKPCKIAVTASKAKKSIAA